MIAIDLSAKISYATIHSKNASISITYRKVEDEQFIQISSVYTKVVNQISERPVFKV